MRFVGFDPTPVSVVGSWVKAGPPSVGRTRRSLTRNAYGERHGLPQFSQKEIPADTPVCASVRKGEPMGVVIPFRIPDPTGRRRTNDGRLLRRRL